MVNMRGEITVFLSLILVCVLSLFLTLVESARTTGARLYLELSVNSAASSVMSQYNRNLWDRYHLLFLETESDEAVEESFVTYLTFYLDQGNLYPMELEHVDVTKKTTMINNGGEALEREILSYMKTRTSMGVDLFSGLSESELFESEDFREYLDYRTVIEKAREEMELSQEMMSEDNEENGSEEQDSEEKTEENGEDSDGNSEAEDEETIDHEKVHALERLTELLDGDLLTFVMPRNKDISKKAVELKQIPSQSLEKGINRDKENLVEQGMIQKYCFLHFDSYLNQREGTNSFDEQPLEYELEYLLFGEDSDRENLNETAESLLAVRAALNLLFLTQSMEHKGAADAFAVAVSGGFAPIQVTVSFLILTLWALGEAIWDVNMLLSGENVPYWKTNEDWKLSLDELFSVAFLDSLELSGAAGYTEPGVNEDQESDGDGYEGYLWNLMYLLNRDTRNGRILDLIQWNVRTIQSDFQVADCVTDIHFSTKVKERHLFVLKNEYTRTSEVVGSYH